MKKTKIVCCVVVILLLAANLYMSFQMQSMLDQLEISAKPKKSLPCESVPISWAVKNYECANSLLLAMNVTNVKFQPKNSTNTILEKAIAQLQNRSYRD